jgi:hypothetical protein
LAIMVSASANASSVARFNGPCHTSGVGGNLVGGEHRGHKLPLPLTDRRLIDLVIAASDADGVSLEVPDRRSAKNVPWWTDPVRQDDGNGSSCTLGGKHE